MKCVGCGNKNAFRIKGGFYKDENGKRKPYEICDRCGDFSVTVKDIWFEKHKLYPDQGTRELHNHLIGAAEKGRIKKPEDKAMLNSSLKRYGRHRVDVGYYDKWVRRDACR